MHLNCLMPTPYESADLILKLYEMRREKVMREARDFMTTFKPKSFEDFMNASMGPQNALIRMVYGYWNMAASFVVNGAIDAKMFDDANAEHLNAYAKIEPFIEQFRKTLNAPDFMKNLEKVCTDLPDGAARLAAIRARTM
jgi:hypothetical protein